MLHAVTIRNKADKRELKVPKRNALDFYCKRGWDIVDLKSNDDTKTEDTKTDEEKTEGEIETAEQLSAEEIEAEQTE